ncbi:hypothetical protein [Arthrobacter sp. NicSoilC5]|uniref:hypothetical protein n=1 Tax=Arthrobacter sp. NicSoilC5 TaxID=2831000 RepID=UPI001CC70EBB|nr:hypothetical protein [Arthrobacter sp. NicSoilC5]
MKYAFPVAAIAGAFAISFLGMSAAALVALGLIAAVLWARDSASRIGALAVSFAIAIPLVPGYQETRTPQVTAYAVVFIVLLGCVLLLLKRRGRPLRLPLSVLGILGGLALLTVGLLGFDQFRLVAGIAVAAGLALAGGVGVATDAAERQNLLKTLTFIAYAMAAIAIYEAIVKHPLYEFTNFQVQANARSAFRAAALFGHPLVLCVFMAFVAVANMARPVWGKREWLFARVPSVAVPLAGAAASGSRSILLMVGVGILAMLVARVHAGGSKVGRFAVAVLAVVLGVLGLQPGSLLSGRLDQLSAQEQAVRLGGFEVVTRITSGAKVIIGGGPRAVAKAANTDNLASFGTVDNQFFTAYADYGLVGFVLVAVLVLTVLAGLRRRGLDPWQRTGAIAGSIFLPAFFVMEPLSWPAVAVLFGFALGFCSFGAGASPEKMPRPDVLGSDLSRTTSAGPALAARRK